MLNGLNGCLLQLREYQGSMDPKTLNQRVVGSSPTAPTNKSRT
jgi:hypothetical protein